MRNLLRRLTARHAFFLSISIVLFGGFQFLICAITSTVDVGGAIQELMKSIPLFMRSTVTEEFFAGFTTRGILAFGWDHPIAQALGAAVAIVLGTRAIAGEIEGGVMELVLSQPLSRRGYLGGQILFAVLALTLLTLGGLVGTIIGQIFFQIEALGSGALLKLGLNFFLLQCAWYSISLAFSVLGREAGRVATAAFLVALSSYIVNVIGKLWSKAAFLLPYTLHTYYSPRETLVQDTLEGKSVVVLCAVFFICIGFAAWRFQRRGIP
jgi:ABC-type transport system involved in multi-copper enzyme maturation permease subunit